VHIRREQGEVLRQQEIVVVQCADEIDELNRHIVCRHLPITVDVNL